MGNKVFAYTDNVALRYCKTCKTAQNPPTKKVHLLAYIGMFDLYIAHIPVL